MKTARMFSVALLPVLMIGLASMAGAADKYENEHGPTAFVPPAAEGGRATGDDCIDPIAIDTLPYYGTGFTNCGRGNTYSNTCLGYYDGGEDIMFRLDLAADAVITIVMNPLGTTWTGILIDDECPPPTSGCIAINTGSSGVRTISNLSLVAGSYYIMFDTWPTPNCIPEFNLTIEEYVPQPPVSFCDDLQAAYGTGTFYGDTCGGQNLLYSFPCIPYTENGLEDYYEVFMPAGSSFTVNLTHSVDSAIWVFDSCIEPFTCLAGADAVFPGTTETLTYTNPGADATVYLVIDS